MTLEGRDTGSARGESPESPAEAKVEAVEANAEVAAVIRSGSGKYLREISGTLGGDEDRVSLERLFERGLSAVLQGERRLSPAASPAGPRETVAAIVQVGAEEQLERSAPAAEDRAALGGLFAERLSVSLEGK